jgi:16S rRNA (cytosine967-C5)-methyltransferase
MALSPARIAALAVARRVFESGAYADKVLRAEAARLADPRDRALAKRLAYGIVQRRDTLDWVIARYAKGVLEPGVRAALWLGLYELLFSDAGGHHAAVSAAVELAKPSPGHKVVNAVLRRVQREGIELPDDATPAGAAVRHSHPRWVVDLWWRQLGADDARLLLAADNEPGEAVVRINTLAPGHEDAELPPGRREDDALVLERPWDIAGSDLFRRGIVTPQSRAAQRVARLLDPQPGERVLDLCAAPGGKTTHLAALMGGEGEVVAVERHPGRAEALRRTCERLHARNVTVVEGDAAAFSTDRPFDRVLIDPPCSGLGTLRSHPDLRWRMRPEAIGGLVAQQDAIVAAARRALRPGGTLVFATCTINAAEERVEGDERHQTLPHRDGTDGFYLAREQRAAA